MATIILSAVGNYLGGPIGSAIGAYAGSQIDAAVFGPGGSREGPRIKDLAVTTSSYGQSIARQFGTMRVAGSVIWATELAEKSETSGGGKGKPQTTTYSYSVSFAVALSSRPIRGIKRIWADGKLLRGAEGDLKVPGALRVYEGHGDQMPDPLIAAAQGGQAPAFRGCAYCVFEDLQLGEFGNRIPALTFEIDAGGADDVALETLVPFSSSQGENTRFTEILGFADEGGTLAEALDNIGAIFPLRCLTGADTIELSRQPLPAANPAQLPEALVDEGNRIRNGPVGTRTSASKPVAKALRYYDRDRDYQPGIQRAGGQPEEGRELLLSLAGVMQADTARREIAATARRERWHRERMRWIVGELNPAHAPGEFVSLPNRAGSWLVREWEWSEEGIALELERVPPQMSGSLPADPGLLLPPPDLSTSQTAIMAFELPWDGSGSAAEASYFVATSASSPSWSGATLYVDEDGRLEPVGRAPRERAIMGQLVTALAPSNALLLERDASVEVELVAGDLAFASVTADQLANGSNRLFVGGEVLQFADAAQIGERRWILRGMLRGRGGTEPRAMAGHDPGAPFALLGPGLTRIDAGIIAGQASPRLAAIGPGDIEPAYADLDVTRISIVPPPPVHASANVLPDGALAAKWTRRARGQWSWLDAASVALIEEEESYLVGLGNPAAPLVQWQTSTPAFSATASEIDALFQAHGSQPLWVAQTGTFGRSLPTLITTIG